MKHYRIKVRSDKSEFFEELLRHLDFLDYEQVESFSEPRIYTNFELKSRQEKEKPMEQKEFQASRSTKKEKQSSSADSLKEVLARIDKMRDKARKEK